MFDAFFFYLLKNRALLIIGMTKMATKVKTYQGGTILHLFQILMLR